MVVTVGGAVEVVKAGQVDIHLCSEVPDEVGTAHS